MIVYMSEAVVSKELDISEEYIEDGEGKKRLRITMEGLFQTAEDENNNKRRYPDVVLERETKKLNEKIKLNGGLLSELDHPLPQPGQSKEDYIKRASKILLEKACGIIHKPFTWDGKNVYGKLRILNDDGGYGQKTASMIKNGFKIGVSSRAVGSSAPFKNGTQTVPDDIRFITYDVVESPSVYNARLKQMVMEEAEYYHELDKGHRSHKGFFDVAAAFAWKKGIK